MVIRSIHRDSDAEVNLVAERMRQTLIEVLWAERGSSMYSMEWLVERVRFHLDPTKCDGEVFLAEKRDSGDIVGHTIVRVEKDDDGPFGLFSTFYVLPECRKNAIASQLMMAGEEWMRERGLARAATDTSLKNDKLIQLCLKQGYRKVFEHSEMLRLAKKLPNIG